MASDQRWTGGIANRDWSAGTTVTAAVDHGRLKADVRAYLADCRKHRTLLNAVYHPTVAGALKAVFHRTDAEAEFIRTAFARELAEVPDA